MIRAFFVCVIFFILWSLDEGNQFATTGIFADFSSGICCFFLDSCFFHYGFCSLWLWILCLHWHSNGQFSIFLIAEVARLKATVTGCKLQQAYYTTLWLVKGEEKCILNSVWRVIGIAFTGLFIASLCSLHFSVHCISLFIAFRSRRSKSHNRFEFCEFASKRIGVFASQSFRTFFSQWFTKVTRCNFEYYWRWVICAHMDFPSTCGFSNGIQCCLRFDKIKAKKNVARARQSKTEREQTVALYLDIDCICVY